MFWKCLALVRYLRIILVVAPPANDRDEDFEMAGTGTGIGEFWSGPWFCIQFEIGRDQSNLLQNFPKLLIEVVAKIPVKFPVKLVFWPRPGFGIKSNFGYGRSPVPESRSISVLHTDWFISLCSTLIGLSQSAPPTPVGAWSEDPDEMLQEWKTSRDWLSRELTIDSVNEENTKSEKRVSKLLSPLQLSFSQIFIKMLFTILLYLQY